MDLRTPRRHGLVLLTGALLATAGCGLQPGTEGSKTSDATAIDLPEGGGQEPAVTAGGDSGGAAIQGASTEKDEQDSRLRFEVLSLKRGDGGLVTLTAKLTNVSGKEFTTGDSIDAFSDYIPVSLVDPVGQKRYLLVTDSDSKCICSKRPDKNIPVGGTFDFWATFPPVPASVKTINVMFKDFPLVERVSLGS